MALGAPTFYGLFQHLNLRTPRWLGYLIQRPESHGAATDLEIRRATPPEAAAVADIICQA